MSKVKPYSKNSSELGISNQENATADDQEKEIKFDRELDWCIQKLNSKLLNEKDSKKANETQKCISLLKNPKTILVKKRQIMYNVFGDYRTKMKAEEKQTKNKQELKLKFVEADSTNSHLNSKFIKKSSKSSKKPNIDASSKPEYDFKFNFEINE